MDKANPVSSELQDCVLNFLARYRASPHSVTYQTLSEMLNNRQMRTRLDLLHPCQLNVQKAKERQKQTYDVHTHKKTLPN